MKGLKSFFLRKVWEARALSNWAFCSTAYQRWENQLNDQGFDHIELAELILDESGYTGMWQNDKTPDAPGRLENLKELVKALENFENIQDF